jgi:hypothetical protein
VNKEFSISIRKRDMGAHLQLSIIGRIEEGMLGAGNSINVL